MRESTKAEKAASFSVNVYNDELAYGLAYYWSAQGRIVSSIEMETHWILNVTEPPAKRAAAAAGK